MSEISEMLRESADDMERNPGVAQSFTPQLLRRLADRIDDAMVEWPLGADKKRIKPSQTVYDLRGCEWEVTGIVLPTIPGIELVTLEHDGTDMMLFSCDLTHERPDSLGRIADELERYANDSCGEDEIDGATASTLVDFAERIRRLAEREDGR